MKSRPSVQFREIPEAQIDSALALAYLVFHEVPDDETIRKQHRDSLRMSLRIGAYDGDELVGLAAALPFELSVPGGELPCPALTFVSVAPTHRRRGVLSGMIAELYARCGEQGAPLSALWASEASIYGRFGFGPGTYGATVEIDSRRPLALRIEPDERPLRLVDPAKAPGVLDAYYDSTRSARAGRSARSEWWWRESWLPEKDEEDEDFSPPRVVALGEPLAGYAIYRTKSQDEGPGLVRLDELEAESPAVAAALWRYLASIDLTGTVRAWGRPLDDPLFLFAADRDQVRVTSEFPALWVRLIDVGAALEARSWAAPADLVLEVTDETVPANAGRHRLTVSPGNPACTPTEERPDLTFAVRDLASCYLGGTRVSDLVAAGVVTEHTPGAADQLDAALRTPRLPHTVDEF
ncbi:GNAT family N-acetyltransferase [Streptomyces iconiensis]|uniref:GNAT family N-acetyltransferase n=1 Tax=Streptomyces iconiensis TaxID=1384038 RepID=A0ABT7ACA6_9ACTN|nr:GNAT family N-acetyltransferase [Streptomyces iconiensis]MDJ1138253.1 GNAT family N-acetyltransferase [Streptomyces iconiensis]